MAGKLKKPEAPGKGPYEDVMERMIEASRSGNASLWDFAEAYHTVADLADFDYESVEVMGKARYGVDVTPKSTASKARSAYQAFCDRSGIPVDEMKNYSPYTAYDVQRLTMVDAGTAQDLLKLMRTTTRRELLKMLREDGTGDDKHLATITIDAAVEEQMTDARAHLAEAVGARKITATAFIEFTARLILDSSHKELLTVWREQHGEE